MKVIRHQLDVYGTVLRMAYDAKTWRKMVNDYPAPMDNMDPDQPPTNHSGSTYVIVWEPHPRKRQLAQTVQHVGIWINYAALERDLAQLVSTVAHECVHAACDIYDKAGESAQAGQLGEPFAYLVDWLVAWVWDNLPCS